MGIASNSQRHLRYQPLVSFLLVSLLCALGLPHRNAQVQYEPRVSFMSKGR